MLIFGYELFRAAAEPREEPELDHPTFEEMESLYAHIASGLDKLGFPGRLYAQGLPAVPYGASSAAFPWTVVDVATMHRIFRQIDKFVAVHKSDAESD